MSWKLDGTFQRTNVEFDAGPNGELWSQDLQASIKIIASRHDFHDEDLALGIAATLNLDGLNEMRSNLEMGSYKIHNIASGSLVTDGVRFGQLIESGSFDEPLRQLTLHTPDGDLPPIVIPSGSGGAGNGTVTSIAIGEGLSGASNPITTTGEINLETINTPVTESNGVLSISVDKHGRVTQVVGGALGGGSSTPTASSWEKSLTVESPGPSEDITWFYTVREITLLSIHIVLVGSSAPSVDWVIKYGPDRTGVGTVIHSKTTTNTTTGDHVTTITTPVIPANNFVWAETTAQSGVVNEMHLTTSGAVT